MSYGTKSISSSDDIIDSRDVIARIEELESDRESLSDAVTEAQEEFSGGCGDDVDRQNAMSALASAKEDLQEWDDSEDAEELKKLKELAEKCENEGDWTHGVSLINDNYFEDYAKQTAEDLGLISGETQWPATCIDWERAANELKSDYTCIEWDDETFYLRA